MRKRLKERDDELRALKSGIALLERSVAACAYTLYGVQDQDHGYGGSADGL